MNFKVMSSYGGFFMSTIRTQDQINHLLQYPELFKHVSEKRVDFTFEFRKFVWEFTSHNPNPASTRAALMDKTADPLVIQYLGSETIKNLAKNLRHHGSPSRNSNQVYGVRNYLSSDPEYDQMLVEMGFLEKRKKGFGFTDKIYLILALREPGTTVESALKQAGINIERMGYQRLYQLIREDRDPNIRPSRDLLPEDLALLNSNPFISSVTERQIRYRKAFDQWSEKLRGRIPADRIAEMFGLDLNSLGTGARLRILDRIRYHNTPEDPALKSGEFPKIPGTQEEVLRFLAAYLRLMKEKTDETLSNLCTLWPNLSCLEKKESGRIIEAGIKEEGFSLSSLLRAAGIPRSSWYATLYENYGAFALKKKEQYRKDFEAVREIMNYKSIRKGSRQIRLQLLHRKGIRMGLEKIRRLMKENGVQPDIRKKSANQADQLDHVRPNLLRRRFRLNRPGEVVLTDVTYLDYGDGRQRAYMSALKDPASGVIYGLLVSDSQNIELGMATIEALPKEGCLFHSDQGILYLSDGFQKLLKARGYEQSMSRRGNCWDNSSMESFFGHFKDECPYQECRTLDDLRSLVSEYAFYYNEERPQPCRRNMTPVEFEKWLNDMSEDEWNLYLQSEMKKYNKMLEEAALSAIERARIDRNVAGESEYGQRKRKEESGQSL